MLTTPNKSPSDNQELLPDRLRSEAAEQADLDKRC